MKTVRSLTVVLLGIVVSMGSALASDPVSVYALVDKVVLEPNSANPERIQIWGVFAIARPNDRNYYQAAQRGYLYFKLPTDKADLARREWTDIKATAGKRQVVAFGNRSQMQARVRATDQRPQAPDVYEIAQGVVSIRSDTDYTPIKSLLEYPGR